MSWWDDVTEGAQNWLIQNGDKMINYLELIKEVSLGVASILPAGRAARVVEILVALGYQVDPPAQQQNPLTELLAKLSGFEDLLKRVSQLETTLGNTESLTQWQSQLSTLEGGLASLGNVQQQLTDMKGQLTAFKTATTPTAPTARPEDLPGKFFSYQDSMYTLGSNLVQMVGNLVGHTSWLSHLPFLIEGIMDLTDMIDAFSSLLEDGSGATTGGGSTTTTGGSGTGTTGGSGTGSAGGQVSLSDEFMNDIRMILRQNQALIQYLGVQQASATGTYG